MFLSFYNVVIADELCDFCLCYCISSEGAYAINEDHVRWDVIGV